MKKRILASVCLALLAFAQVAPAEDAGIGLYAESRESQARLNGQEVKTETSFTWGGLPLLDEKQNDALDSLTQTLKVTTRRQGSETGGYVGADVYLQDVSVLDLTLLRQDGVYYEQSNLLGGQTVAFTKDEFADFTRALSERSQGAMPQNLSWLFELVMRALGGEQDIAVNTELIDSAIAAFDGWRVDALQTKDRLRPSVYIPSIYGARATVTDVTREEALMLVDAFVDLVSGDNALWESAVRAQIPHGDDNQIKEVLAQIEALLAALPETAQALLPEGGDPAEYREIYGLDGSLVAKQVEAALLGDVSLLVEWIPVDRGVPALYASLSAGGSEATLLLTREDGTSTTTGKVNRQRNRYVAEFMLDDPELSLNVIMTRSEHYELREDKETLTAKTDWMIESEELLGAGAIVTISLNETDTAGGEGAEYARRHVADWTVKGLGFDNQKILTVTSHTAFAQADSRIEMEGDITRPAQLDGEAMDAWLKGVEVSFQQVIFTCLGRLPSNVAAYVLEQMDN